MTTAQIILEAATEFLKAGVPDAARLALTELDGLGVRIPVDLQNQHNALRHWAGMPSLEDIG